MWHTLLPHPRDDHITVCRHNVPHHCLVSSTTVLLFAGLPSLRAATADRKRGIQRFDLRELARLPQSLMTKPRLFCNPARAAERASFPEFNSPVGPGTPSYLFPALQWLFCWSFTACPHCGGEAVAIDDVVPLRRNPASRAGSAGASASRYAR